MPSSKSAKSSSSDGGKVVKTILSFLFLGIVCSSLNRTYNLICDLSKAEVNVEFGDSGDSITATATTRVEAPVGEQAADDPEEVGEHPYNFSKAWNKIIQNMIKYDVPEVFFPNSLPNVFTGPSLMSFPTSTRSAEGHDH